MYFLTQIVDIMAYIAWILTVTLFLSIADSVVKVWSFKLTLKIITMLNDAILMSDKKTPSCWVYPSYYFVIGLMTGNMPIFI